MSPDRRARKAETTRLWRERNPGYNAKRRARNAELARLWHERNPGWRKAYDQRRRLDPEIRKRDAEWHRLWYARNPGHRVKKSARQKANDQKRYQDPEIRARKVEMTRLWGARRRKNDPAYRILHNCRGRLHHALRGVGAKSARTLELIGCTAQQLKLHLEAQFKPKMTWENYGSYWQIDHIFPCAKFDLSQPEQQRQCFHFSNLQPLTAEENLQKSDN